MVLSESGEKITNSKSPKTALQITYANELNLSFLFLKTNEQIFFLTFITSKPQKKMINSLSNFSFQSIFFWYWSFQSIECEKTRYLVLFLSFTLHFFHFQCLSTLFPLQKNQTDLNPWSGVVVKTDSGFLLPNFSILNLLKCYMFAEFCSGFNWTSRKWATGLSSQN